MPNIRTQVNGVKYGDCQSVIANLQLGDDLSLCREPDNPKDRNAVLVLDSDGEKAGYLPRGLAANVAPLLDLGDGTWPAKVQAILGGFEDTAFELRISYEEPEFAEALTA